MYQISWLQKCITSRIRKKSAVAAQVFLLTHCLVHIGKKELKVCEHTTSRQLECKLSSSDYKFLIVLSCYHTTKYYKVLDELCEPQKCNNHVLSSTHRFKSTYTILVLAPLTLGQPLACHHTYLQCIWLCCHFISSCTIVWFISFSCTPFPQGKGTFLILHTSNSQWNSGLPLCSQKIFAKWRKEGRIKMK